MNDQQLYKYLDKAIRDYSVRIKALEIVSNQCIKTHSSLIKDKKMKRIEKLGESVLIVQSLLKEIDLSDIEAMVLDMLLDGFTINGIANYLGHGGTNPCYLILRNIINKMIEAHEKGGG